MSGDTSFGDRIVAAGFAAGWKLVPLLPERPTAAVFRFLADRVWARHGKSVARLESNLARVTGLEPGSRELSELTRAGMRSYFRYFHEIFRLPRMSGAEIVRRTRVVGAEHIHDTVAAGRGVVLALPHMGNWDQAGAWLVNVGHPFTTVAERLKPESLFRRYVAFREGLGMEVLPLTGGDGHNFATLALRVRRGGVVCLPAERDLTKTGVEVRFFGATTKMPAGPPLLAVQTGAALLPAIVHFDGDDWGIHIQEELPVPAEGTRQDKVKALAQGLADAFEKGIAEHPEDWHMLQRLWLDDLPPGAGR
ncbi:phosphatidylinositol mannoside acyltransferase [Nonomuraea wenchangensis]|uniref:KDO2-lipid IV(A) lauroyltransferase n=1 Tax=Nonomuraea wenchangensis TaxID=568860 RepID=A0A1I0JAQ2_9ACTN|nr:phosphatidylinositol mannoside acyltransferase [Nonomuraea wenchangensis]SEU07093.1 KDO2-lipid IV(A) lauroyltransferase [Nonomuraea wenchangensis]